MVRAKWNGVVLAESNDTVIVDRKHYFLPEDIKMEFLIKSDKHSLCEWKGEASYYSILVDGKLNEDAAWYYPNPKEKAISIKSRIAFSYIHGIDIIEEED